MHGLSISETKKAMKAQMKPVPFQQWIALAEKDKEKAPMIDFIRKLREITHAHLSAHLSH